MKSISQDQIILIIGSIIPLIVSNVLHMIVVKFDYLASLKRPLHVGWFGSNKTLRGFVFVPLANGLVYLWVNFPGGWLLSHLSPNYQLASTLNLGDINLLNLVMHQFLIGGSYGLFYMLFELPNSWLKRRLGIASGKNSSTNQWLFTLLDKTDSALGVSLIFGFMNDHHFNFGMMFQFFFCAAMLHFAISGLLVVSKIKKSF